MNPYSKRILIGTYLSKPPRPSARLIAGSHVLLLTLTTWSAWEQCFGGSDGWIATREKAFHSGEYWRLLTAILIHSDSGHLLGNLIVFAILSYLLSGYFGFFVYPVAAFAFGALTNALTLLSYPPKAGLLGASGVVYWMAGFWVTLYFCIDRRYSFRGRLLRSVGFALAVFAPTSYSPNVAYRAHAIGFLLGIAFGLAYFWSQRPVLRQSDVYVEETSEFS